MGTQSYLHLLYRHSPSEWDRLTRTESEPISTGPFPQVICIIRKPQILLFQRNPKASLTSYIQFCSLITQPGMIVSSCCRCYSPRKNGSESWQRRRNGSRGLTGDQPPSFISWTRGFLCCSLTGILSKWKIESVFECTARL